MSHPTISLVSDRIKTPFPTLLWEVLSEKDITKIASIGLSTEYLDVLHENLHKKTSERQMQIQLYVRF